MTWEQRLERLEQHQPAPVRVTRRRYKPTATERREYADSIRRQRKLANKMAQANGESLWRNRSANAKDVVETALAGLFLGDMFR